MKRFWIFNTIAAVVVMTALLVFLSDGYFLHANEQPMNEDMIPSQGEMSDNNDDSDFACNLFRAIHEQKGDSSIIVSPLSVGYMLGMLNEGADGKTRQQITDILGLRGSVEEINMYFKKKMDEASDIDPRVTVKIANSIDVNSALGINLIPQYKADMQKYYNAQVDVMDFNDGNSLSHINNWCKTHTDGMIPMILKRINPDAAMYLLNAIYFKASWTEKFDPKETRDKHFTKQDGTIINHKMMHLKTETGYGENDLCKMLCLPYGNKGYSMYVLLPKGGKTVDDIIQSLSAQELEQQRKRKMSTREVDILMPRFTTESEINLNDILSSMGMPLAFDRLAAEFPNMVTQESQTAELYVSMMKQKAKIEVNEEGTKAAAVTVTEMQLKGDFGIDTFHATRPFVYYIVENSTGTILFMGTYFGEKGAVQILSEAERAEPKDSIYHSVEQMPQFPGGDAALMKYIQPHLNYPPMAAHLSIQGCVVLQFVVDKTGKVGEVKVARSVDKELDHEAVRLVKTLPNFTPGRQNGEPVNVWYTLPVRFKLKDIHH